MSNCDPVLPDRSRLIQPERELPAISAVPDRRAATARDVAHSVGNAVGSAVTEVRRLPQRMQQMKSRFVVIQGRARHEARQKAADLAADVKDKAGETFAHARARANRVAREYPFGVVAGAAAAGFLIGMALRIGRDHE